MRIASHRFAKGEDWVKEYPYLTYHWTSEHEFTLGTSSELKEQHGGRE